VRRALQRRKQLGTPLVEVVVDALVVVAVAAAHDRRRAQRVHALLDALADGVEVLVLLVAEAEHAVRHVLRGGSGGVREGAG
jgi:hypothetical protein